MINAETVTAQRPRGIFTGPVALTKSWDRILFNPWSWMILAFVAAGVALLPLVSLDAVGSPSNLVAVFLGVVSVLVALTIRLQSTQPASLSALPRPLGALVLPGLVLLFAALAMGISGLLVVAYMRPYLVPWRWGPVLLCWLVVAPVSELAMTQCWRRWRRGELLGQREEGAILLLLAALVTYAMNWALLDRDDPLEFDTIRLFLSVLTFVAVVAAPLVLVEVSTRRKVVSLLILMHFGGIITATLRVVPYHDPMPADQVWTRLSRPYLEFLFMTNAYHFYAPEPGPMPYLWFRVLFENDPPAGEDAETSATVTGEWFKVPDLDENGRAKYPMGIDLQRFICLCENTGSKETAPALFYIEGRPTDGRHTVVYDRRLQHTPSGAGVKDYRDYMNMDLDVVPWHPDYSPLQQRQVPAAEVKDLIIPSYVRHVLAMDRWAGKRIKGVKVYRVIHDCLPTEIFRMGIMKPGDPDTYKPVYFGEFNKEGKLVDPDDPLLYWMLPTLRLTPLSDARILCFARRHAGDPLWVRDEDGKWIAPEVPAKEVPQPEAPQ